MVTILWSYAAAVGYSIIVREAFGVAAASPWNWAPAAAIIMAGIILVVTGAADTPR